MLEREFQEGSPDPAQPVDRDSGHGTLLRRYASASRMVWLICATAARVAGVCANAFRTVKAWIVPRYLVAVTRTPAAIRRRAYASPSSRTTSNSAVMMSAGGTWPSSESVARSGAAVASVRITDSGAY